VRLVARRRRDPQQGRRRDQARARHREHVCGRARRRIRTTPGEIDDNQDESIKSLANQAFELEKFAWDML